MIAGIGHNRGPDLDDARWRRHCWSKARADLLPHLPLNVIRRRVARARELGLDYTTYATVRATTGSDIVALLFSRNGLGLVRRGAGARAVDAAKLAAVARCLRLGLLPEEAARDLPLDAVHDAPSPLDGFAAQRARLDAARRAHRLPADGVLLIGDAPWEAEWCAAGRLAGYIDRARFFGAI